MTIKINHVGEINTNTHGTKMKIVRYGSNEDIDIEFLDDFHYVKEHQAYTNFKTGSVKNPFDKTIFGVGYLGDGRYEAWVNGEPTVEYYIWKQILCRCYNKNKKEKYESYYEVSEMCNEWLNYQNFAEWYSKHKYECDGRLHVDKDIKYPGNKLYSPYHCVLVPQRINMLFSNKRNKRVLPNGIYKNRNGYLAEYGEQKLGVYPTLEEAYAIYAMAKEKKIKEVANEYKGIIPKKVYEALYDYKVDIRNDKNYKAA